MARPKFRAWISVRSDWNRSLASRAWKWSRCSRVSGFPTSWKEENLKIAEDANGNTPQMHMAEHGITLRHGGHKGHVAANRRLRPCRSIHRRRPQSRPNEVSHGWNTDGTRTSEPTTSAGPTSNSNAWSSDKLSPPHPCFICVPSVADKSTNRKKLKTYATKARRDFIQVVTDRAAHYGVTTQKP